MAIDPASVATLLPDTVPMVRTLDLEFVELSHERAVLRLPDNPLWHNHLGGPHAGAMFTLGESASGAIVFANFGDLLERAVPLAVECTIRYLRLAMGPVDAEAVLDRPAAEVVAELDAGTRPEFPVSITIRDHAGETTGVMTVLWTLRPHRKA